MAKRKKTGWELLPPSLRAALEPAQTAAKKLSQPTDAQKHATIFVAEHDLLPAEVKATTPTRTGPPQAPYKKGYGPPATKAQQAKALDDRYKTAVASAVVPGARVELAATMSKQRRKEILDQQRATEAAQARLTAAATARAQLLQPKPQPWIQQPTQQPWLRPTSTVTPGLGFKPSPPPVGGGIDWGSVGHKVGHFVANDLKDAVLQNPLPSVTINRHGVDVDPGGWVNERVAATAETAPVLVAGAAAEAVKGLSDYVSKLAVGTAGSLAYGSAALSQGSAQPRLTPVEKKTLSAGIVPSAVVDDSYKVLRNLAAAQAGVAYGGATHPIREIQKGAGDVHTMLRAITQIAGVVSNPNAVWSDRVHEGRDLMIQAFQSYVDAYGPDTTLAEAFSYGQDHPVQAVMDGISALSIAVGVPELVLARASGLTLRQAIRLLRDPETPRTLRLQQRGAKLPSGGRSTPGKPLTVEIPQSSSPGVRVIQRGVDLASRLAEATPAVRRLPIAEGRRAARWERRNINRNLRRLPAEVRSIFQAAEKLRPNALGLGGDSPYMTALAVLIQKPKNFTDEEFVTAVLENMKDMLAHPEKFDLPETGPSPGEQRLLNRISRYEKKAEGARVRQHGQATKDVYHEQQRLSDALDEVNAQLDDVKRQRDEILGGPRRSLEDLTPEHIGQLQAEYVATFGEEALTLPIAMHGEPDFKTWAERQINSSLGAQIDQTEWALLENLVAQQHLADGPKGENYADEANRLIEERGRLEQQMADLKGQLTPEQKAALDDLRKEESTLGIQATVARSNLNEVSVNQSPIESAARDQFIETLQQIPYFSGARRQRRIDDMVAVGDARARVWARQTGHDPGEWWDRHEFQLAEQHEIPASAFNQIAFSLRRDLPPERAERNLRYAAGGDLHKPELGNQENKPAFRTIRGERVQVFGRITPEEWVKRTVAVIRDPVARDKFARWYAEVAPTFERFFGDDAEQILRGFAVSQANASPADGLTAVMRILDKVRRGEPVSKTDGSVVADSIAMALRGEHVTKGLEKKLHDFTDSIEGKSTRTWMGDDPRGGWPVANDVHAIRDLGYIDKKIVNRLRQPEPTAHFQRGFRDSQFKVDSGGSPSDHQYERMREQYEAITAHLNEIGFDGRSDWTPSQVQALGWSAIQILHGADPENLLTAVAHNTRRVNLEVTRGISGIGDDLTLAEATQVAHAMEGTIRDLVDEVPGLWWDEGIDVAVSAYEGTPNASMHFNLIGSPEKIRDFVADLSDAFDQYDVWATREGGNNAKPTLIIDHPDLADPAKAVALYNKLYEAEPKKFAGFMSTTTKDGTPAIALIMPGKPVTVAGHADAVKALRPVIKSSVRDSLGNVDYGARVANSQVISKEWRSGAEKTRAKREAELRGRERGGAADDHPGVGGARSQRTLDDPRQAQVRTRLESAVADVRAGRPTEHGRVSNQSRGADVRGATQWLEEDEGGRRVIYLTENADASTVLHELFGHATDEMRALYPDQFQAVELELGKPYADWEVADHERFATMVERFFAEGFAPTPELVPVFNRIKGWMRSIYAGMRRLLGDRIPPETRRLFEGYFGAWDDPGVSRVTDQLARSRGSSDAVDFARASGTKATAEKELKALRQRNETRLYNTSLDGLVAELDELTKELADHRQNVRERRGEDPFEMSVEEQARVEELTAQILETQAAIVIRADKREMNLREKIGDLEKALQRGLDNRRLQGAVEAMQWIASDRERILREAFGTQYDEVFANRKDLLADWLVSKGLLEPDFERGSASYYPHVYDEGFFANLKQPAASLTRNVVGKTQAHLNRLHKRNHMIRWQNGDWSADPAVLLEAHARAASYQWMTEIKGLLYEIARPFREGVDDLPQNLAELYIINPNGTPLGPELGAAVRRSMSKSNTTTAHDMTDGLLGDDQALEASIKSYFDAYAIDGNSGVAKSFNPAEHPELRVLDKATVRAILRPIQGSQGGAAKAWDLGTTLARISLIYANVPGYMIANGAGNLGLLLMQQGWRIGPTIARSRRLLMDTPLRIRIFAETGDLPLQAIKEVGRGFDLTRPGGLKKIPAQGVGYLEHGLIKVESLVDSFPRAVAWIYEANKAGYRSRSQLIALLDGKTAKALRDRARVSDRATNHMVDFNRLGDYERQYLTRAFFIWPYVRGATAWPFWYAKNYPLRTVALTAVGDQLVERQEEMLGPVPPWYEDLFPISKRGARAQVANAQMLSPTSMANQQLRFAQDVIASLAGRAPDQHSSRIIDIFAPFLRNSVSLATGRDNYGQDQSLQELITGPDGLVKSLVPFWRLYDAAMNPERTPRASYKYDRGKQDRWMRTFVRIAPQTFSIPWLNAQAQIRGVKTTEQKIEENTAVAKKHYAKVDPHNPMPAFFRKQVVMKTVYEDRVTQYAIDMASRKNPDFEPSKNERGDWDVRYHPTKFEQAKIAYGVMQYYMPVIIKQGQLPPIEKLAAREGIRVGTAKAELLGEQYLKVFHKLTSSSARIDTGAKKVDLANRLDREG